MFGKINDTFIYCPGMVRSASTSTNTVLSSYKVDYKNYLIKGTYEDMKIKNKHLPREVINLPDNTYKFFIYRDPWSRLYSMYRWGLQISIDYKQYSNIDSFVDHEIKNVNFNEKFYNCYRYWSALRWAGDLDQYDMVVHYKEVNKVYKKLNEKFSLNLKVSTEVHSTDNLKEKMSSKTKDFISYYYKDEIDYFNFKYDE